jgi:hypothetical protein
MDQIERIIQRTGWQRDVVEFLLKQHQESGSDGDFLDTLADAYGSAAFISAADAGCPLDVCQQAYEIGVELKTMVSPVVDVDYTVVVDSQAAITTL